MTHKKNFLDSKEYARLILDLSESNDRPMTEWNCPQCGESNVDFEDWHTHCAHCGEIVYVLQDGCVDDENKKVDVK